MNPLGVGEIAWEHDPDGETFGRGRTVYVRPGHGKAGTALPRRRGIRGKTHSSADWVRRRPPQVTRDRRGMLRLRLLAVSGIGFAATGAYSQVILAMPEDNAVLAAHAYNTEGFDYPEMIRRIKASEIR